MSQPDAPVSAPQPPDRSVSARWANRLTVAAALAVVLVPLSIQGIPREIARWYAAAARESLWQENRPQALERIDQAIAWDPDSPYWWKEKAELFLAKRDYAAAWEAIERAYELEPDNYDVLITHGHLAIHVDRPEAAIRDAERFVELYEQENAVPAVIAYNAKAYLLALANTDLEEALRCANKALDKAPDLPGLLDTRGFVYYRLGRLAEARQDMEKAVVRMRMQTADFQNELKTSSTDRRHLQPVESIREAQAVLLYHRALIYEALGLEVEAALDRAAVRDLGFRPGEHLF